MNSNYLKYIIETQQKTKRTELKKIDLKKIENENFRFEPFIEKKILKGNKLRKVYLVSEKNKPIDRITYNYLSSLDIYPKNQTIYEISKNINKHFRKGELNFLRIDIKDFFNNISHKKLLDKIGEFEDSKLYSVILSFINTPRKIDKRKAHINKKNNKHSNEGVTQGTAIAQALSNIYLIDFDNKIKSEINNEEEIYFRYTDDICLLLKDEEKTLKLKEIIEREFENLELEINNDKLIIGNIKEKSFNYLGFEHSKNGIRLSKTTIEKIKENYIEFFNNCKKTAGIYLTENENKPFKIWRNLAIKVNCSIRGYSKNWADTYTEDNVYGLARHLSIVNDKEQIVELQRWLSGVSKYFCYRICNRYNLAKTYVELDSILNWYFRYKKNYKAAIKLAYDKHKNTRVSMPSYLDQDLVDFLDVIDKNKENEENSFQKRRTEEGKPVNEQEEDNDFESDENENEYILIGNTNMIALHDAGVYYDDRTDNWEPIPDDWRVS